MERRVGRVFFRAIYTAEEEVRGTRRTRGASIREVAHR